MQKDVWYLPHGSSHEAQFLKDANVNYLWSDTSGNGSLALSFEAVLEKARDADLWLSPSYYGSFEQLEKANSLYEPTISGVAAVTHCDVIKRSLFSTTSGQSNCDHKNFPL